MPVLKSSIDLLHCQVVLCASCEENLNNRSVKSYVLFPVFTIIYPIISRTSKDFDHVRALNDVVFSTSAGNY